MADSTAVATDPPPVSNPEDPLLPENVVSTARKRMQTARTHTDTWRDESRTLYDLVAGHQWDGEDASRLREKYQNSYPMVTFNVAGKYLDAVQGLQINNRQEVRYFPRNIGQAGVDEYATGVVKWNREQCGAEDEESDAFRDLVLTGMGWVEHFYDDTEESEGFIAQERRDPLEMYWDPRARRNGLADRQWQVRVKPMTPDAYRQQFGEDPPGMDDRESGADADSSSPQIIPPIHDYGTSKDGSMLPKQVYVLDYQFWILSPAVHVKADFGKGAESKTLPVDKWEALKPQMQQIGVQFSEEPLLTKRYYRCWIAGEKVKGKVNELACGCFTFEAMTGKRDRNTNTWTGLGRSMMDPSRWVNKFFSSILYTLMTSAKGGLMAETGAFESDKDAEKSWSDPSSITKMNPGAISGGKVMPKPQAAYPQGMDRLMTFSLDALPLTTGLNPEILGLANREQAGVLESQRKQAALAIISWAFDAMRRYHKRSGRLLLDMIRVYMPADRLVRINTKEGQQFVPMLKDKMTADFDIVIDEAPTSVNMQERTWAVLKELLPMAQQAGVPIPPSILEFAPLPAQLQQDWLKLLQPNPETQAMNKREKEANVVLIEGNAKRANAQAEESIARPQLARLEAQLDGMKHALTGHVNEINNAHDNATKQLVAEIQRDSVQTVEALKAAVSFFQGQQAGAMQAMAEKEAADKAAAQEFADTQADMAEAQKLMQMAEALQLQMQDARKPRDVIYDDAGNIVRLQ